MSTKPIWNHSTFARREALQIGAASILGLGTNHLLGLAEARAASGPKVPSKAKSCIFIFLSGGLAQHESFDMKPDAPAEIRGEFRPIATKTAGLQICEHLPKLAKISHLWSLCRSLTHPSNDHSAGHHIMLTGQSQLPVGFNPNAPSRTDHPSIASKLGHAIPIVRGAINNNLPPAVVLPERLIHNTGRVLPGQHAGMMGQSSDPWFIEASPFHTTSYGAFPDFAFDHQQRGKPDERIFQAPQLSVPQTQGISDIHHRMELLDRLNRQRKRIDQIGESAMLDRHRQTAASMILDPKVHKALDVAKADPAILKDRLLPPTDQALAALLGDLEQSGQLDETLVVVAGEFGRTAKITLLAEHYKLPGRDHWGASQSVLMAGGGIQPGVVVGKTDAKGEYPVDTPVKPENFAATIYHLLGIPSEAVWQDTQGRPFAIYHGEPIAGLV